MNRINWQNLPPDPEGWSFGDTKKAYRQIWNQLDECKRMRHAVDATLRARSVEVRGTKEDLRRAKGQIVTLTKKEHQKSKEKSAAAYATTAATMLIIGYQVVEVFGGWGRWAPVFEHEATIGVLQVCIGSVLAFAMRPLQH